MLLKIIKHSISYRLLDFLAISQPLIRASRLQHGIVRFLSIKTEGEVWLGPGFRAHKPNNIHLGRRVCFGGDARLFAYDKIHIGDDFICAQEILINTGTHDPLSLQPVAKPIKIGNRVWFGARVFIGAGVTIGDDVVIGAGSVVLDDVPSGSIAAGIPCRVIKPLVREPKLRIWSAFNAYQI